MKVLIFFLSLFSLNAFSYDAIVIVLEAPLLKKPDMSSTVYQTLRQGSRVYVPREIGDLENLPEFVQTYDRVGNIAYIPTKYIKIITHTVAESKMPVTIPVYDPTDYRLDEPIPTTYPFDNSVYLRANLSLVTANNRNSPYAYQTPFNKQDFSNENGVRLNVTRKVTIENFDRYYFGLYGAINTSTTQTNFQNSNQSIENRSLIRIGPLITYDALKNAQYRFTLGTGFTYNYHRSLLTMTATDKSSEQRLFNGFSLSPFANSTIQFVDIFPKVDLVGGADFNLFLPSSQKESGSISLPELWGTNPADKISSSLKAQVAFFLGVQVRY